MRIKRFNEDDQVDISSDRVNEIITELSEIVTMESEKSKSIESLLGELGNYKNLSKRGNDQIDDSISNLQVIKKNIDDNIDKIDSVVNNLKDYNESGRKYLYSEE
jgi:ABC-type transporter Mla subunit MlaD